MDYNQLKTRVSKRNNGNTLAECYINDSKISEGALFADLGGLLIAGIDSTSHTIEVGILLLGKYPQVQDIIYKELKQVFKVNHNIQFNLSKINLLHHFKAFIYEALRISCAFPDGFMRTCDKDIRCIKLKQNENNIICDYPDSNNWTKYKLEDNIEYDYIIPKNSWIEINIAYLLKNNRNVWNLDNDPMTLNLNYWLKKDGKFYNNQNIVPFGAGTRQCPGQVLAIKECFAFFGNLLSRYQIIAPNNDPNSINIKYTFGQLTSTVEPQIPVQVKKRQVL